MNSQTIKIPIENIYFLLCYAWNALDERRVVGVDASTAQTLPNLFARVLANGTRHLIRRGFDRGYVNRTDRASRLRGRVLFRELARASSCTLSLPCNFDELEHDVLHNRILKATLRELARTEGVARETRDVLLDQISLLGTVADIPLASSVFRQVQLHRNNQFYGFLMRVCELVHQNILPAEGAGRRHFREFAGDERQMGHLFEGFVREFYRRHLPVLGFKVGREDIRWQLTTENEGDASYLPKMQTDVSLRSALRKVIIECKFTPEATKRNYEAERLRSAHLNQVFAYLNNLKSEAGADQAEVILLYPTVHLPLSLRYRDHKGRPISVRTVDLNQAWQGIHQQLLELVG